MRGELGYKLEDCTKASRNHCNVLFVEEKTEQCCDDNVTIFDKAVRRLRGIMKRMKPLLL